MTTTNKYLLVNKQSLLENLKSEFADFEVVPFIHNMFEHRKTDNKNSYDAIVIISNATDKDIKIHILFSHYGVSVIIQHTQSYIDYQLGNTNKEIWAEPYFTSIPMAKHEPIQKLIDTIQKAFNHSMPD